jgi:DNA polymerase-3 subunit gamma/tau
MSDYIVTARKWRPMRFEDVVGQDHITRTLRNAIATDRLAHAFLFSGPRGVGKTTTARLLAKAVNCLHPVEANPDNACAICKEITEGTSFDVLEIDGASNRGIEEIRNLRESVRYAPARGKYKIYIIDEVHMLTKEAFNALLKTLEEPPAHVMFIFATTEIHKVPATILSRCQRFDFRRIGLESIVGNLRAIAKEEKLEIEDEALMIIARKGDGSLRDAQSIFDQAISLCGRTISHQGILQALNMVDQGVYFRVTGLIAAQDAPGAIGLVEELMGAGHDIKEFLGGLLEHFRNLMVVKTTGSTRLLEMSDVYKARYEEEAQKFSIADLLRYQRHVNRTEDALRFTIQPRFRLEADLVQLVTLPRAAEVATILAGLEELKKKLSEKRSHGDAAPGATTPGTQQAPGPPPPASFAPHSPPSPARRFGGTPGPGPKEAPPPASVQGRALSADEVRSRWEEIVGEIVRQKVSLKACMESATVGTVARNSVTIVCADEFSVSQALRNRDFLAETLSKILNAQARVEIAAPPVEEGPAPGRRSAGPSPGKQAGRLSAAEPEHPMLTVLKRELGAEPLE